jgi:hypothetical protein
VVAPARRPSRTRQCPRSLRRQISIPAHLSASALRWSTIRATSIYASTAPEVHPTSISWLASARSIPLPSLLEWLFPFTQVSILGTMGVHLLPLSVDVAKSMIREASIAERQASQLSVSSVSRQSIPLGPFRSTSGDFHSRWLADSFSGVPLRAVMPQAPNYSIQLSVWSDTACANSAQAAPARS